MSLLVGEELTGGYGGPDILRGCAITAERGEITVVVGPNGAGKSTAMKALFGLLQLRARARCAWTARTSPRWRPRRGRARAWGSCRRRTTCSAP